jgi:uncharacterized repeat protein (TIGR01451 family)
MASSFLRRLVVASGCFSLLVMGATTGVLPTTVAGATYQRGAIGTAGAPRLAPAPLPAPLPSAQQRAQAAADRPDPFTPAPPTSPSGPLPVGAWTALGPAPIGPPYLASGGFYGGANSGRITTVLVIPSGTHAGRIVIGSAGGGVWTTDNDGATWTPRSDQAPSLAIGALTEDPSTPDHLIAGTGEANQSGDSYPGFGLLVSTDGGTTWTTQNPGGVFTGLHVAELAINPSNTMQQFAATSAGLYVTTNGGTSWAKPTDTSYAAVDGNITAVVLNPTTTTTVYLGGGAKTVAESTDGGVHWAAADTGISPPGSFGFTALAIAASSPTTLYAAVGSTGVGGLYRTINGGTSWTLLSSAPDYTGQGYSYYGTSGGGYQGWYDNVLAVDPTNANHLLAGGIALIETTDGGTTWINVNGQAFFGGGTNRIHPDQHALCFDTSGRVLSGDDGGMYRYVPSTKTVANLNGNLDITQFYFGFNEVKGTLLAGSQDNGSARTASSSVAPWTGIWPGDGGPSAIVANHTQIQLIEADRGLYVTTDAFATVLNNITPPQLGLFTPPEIAVPNTASPSNPTVFYGGADLWRTTNPTAASPTWSQVTSVGTSVSAIAASPTSASVIYVGFTNGTIQVSTNRGLTFTSLGSEPFTSRWVTGISVDPTNAKAITASFSYNDTRYSVGLPHAAQYAYATAPGTGTWTVITGNLPAQAAVSRVVYDHGALLAATDAGVYGTTSPAGSSTVWSVVGTGLPAVQAQDLFVDGASGDVYAITHGRGAWKLRQVADLSVNKTGPSSITKGSDGSYTVTVTNNGPATSLSVKLTDAVPTGTTFVSETQTGGPAFTCTNPAVGSTGTTTCKLASMATAATATFTLVYLVPTSFSGSSVSEKAHVSSATFDPKLANNTKTVVTPVV